jgi:hypothetical protein
MTFDIKKIRAIRLNARNERREKRRARRNNLYGQGGIVIPTRIKFNRKRILLLTSRLRRSK